MGMKILIAIFFLTQENNRTRGHEVTLAKDHCRLDIRKYSFSQRTINEWNKLSTDCVTASSVNMFKNKVDTLSISLWLPCPFAICAFALDGNLVKSKWEEDSSVCGKGTAVFVGRGQQCLRMNSERQ